MKSLSAAIRSLVSASRASTCEACGKDFCCGASLAGCWCANLSLSDTARAELRTRYSRCLCRQCLEVVAVVLPASEGAPNGLPTETVNSSSD